MANMDRCLNPARSTGLEPRVGYMGVQIKEHTKYQCHLADSVSLAIELDRWSIGIFPCSCQVPARLHCFKDLRSGCSYHWCLESSGKIWLES